jgi:hypothetical protein
MTPRRVSGHFLAWTTLIFALSASIGANVAQAQPNLFPRLFAAAAPVAVIFASALLERMSLTGVGFWRKLAVIGGMTFVVATAFVTSFQHQRHLLLRYGNDDLSAILLPLSIDALIIMASVCLAVIAEQRRQLAEVAEPADDAAPEPVGTSGSAPEPTTTVERPKRQRRAPTTEERITAARKRWPDLSAAALARKLDLSDKTVRDYLKTIDQADEPQPVNGAEVPELVTAS